MARREALIALALVAFGSLVVLEAWRMPRFGHLAVNPYTVPGIVPGFLGAIIALLGLAMIVRTVLLRRAAAAVAAAADGAAAATPAYRRESRNRLALTLVLTLGYAGGLVGRLPFGLATFLFVATFITLFGWSAAAGPRRRGVLVATAVVQAGIVAIAVVFVFERLFLVRLP